MATQTEERVNGTAVDAAPRKPTIVEVINAVMAEVQAVGKGDRNNEQGYNFRGIDAVVNAVGPIFRKHGVVAVPMLETAGYRDVQTSRGKPSRECTVQVRYRFYGPGGDYLDAVVPGESMDFGDKGTAKAMSVAYRIALLQLLTIPTHEPDPDASAYERDNAPPRPPMPAQPTEEQAAAFTELARHIAVAETQERLRELYTAAAEAFKADRITAGQGNELRAAIEERVAEIQAEQPDAVPPVEEPAQAEASHNGAEVPA